LAERLHGTDIRPDDKLIIDKSVFFNIRNMDSLVTN